MFDLDRAISDWRVAQSATGGANSETIEELESHLRDETFAFERKGLSPEEGFLLAVRRLGSPQEISAEFAKVDNTAIWMNRLRWMLAGYLVTNIGSLIFNLSTNTAELLVATSGVPTRVAVLIACWAPMTLFAITSAVVLQSRFRGKVERVVARFSGYLSTPTLAFLCCASILFAYTFVFICHGLFIRLGNQDWRLVQSFAQTVAWRDYLIMLLGPMAATVSMLAFTRRRRGVAAQEILE